MIQPLAGIRVVDLSQNLAGPFCSQILADLGADVIKVEPPGGDSARPWGPPFWGADSTLFLSVARGKRSIVVDVKDDRGIEIVRRLAADADVFLEASRQGVAERLGFDYDSICAINRDIVYLSVSAYGDRGPLAGQPGYDPLIQAFTGIMSLTGHPDGPPSRVGGSVIDFGTGMWGAISVLGALRQRDASGDGARLDVALMDTALNWVSYHLMGYMATGDVPGRMGTGLVSIVPYEAFPVTDGEVMIAAGSDPIFRRLCGALDLQELATDPRFATNPARVENRDGLVAMLRDRTARLSTSELVAKLFDAAVPCSPIRSVDEVLEVPQVEASGMVPRAPNPSVDDYRDVSLPLRIGGDRPRSEQPPPRMAEHSREILGEIGYSAGEIDDLVAAGVVTVATNEGETE